MAPEQLASLHDDGRFGYSTASDVFSFGVLLFELFERKTPWQSMQNIDIRAKVGQGKRLPIDETLYPTFVFELLDSCWNYLAQQRPTMSIVASRLAQPKKTTQHEEGSEESSESSPVANADSDANIYDAEAPNVKK